MTKEKNLEITKTYDLGKPTEVVAMAVVLKDMVVRQNLFTNIKGKNYVHIEGWQMAAFLTGMTAVVDEPKDLSNDKEVKWSCSAKIYQGDKVVGVGYALCSSKESTKKGFDEYAILSMSQTRAIGKAYRNKIGWIMKLAGYESTPSEEMRKVDEMPKDGPAPIVGPEGTPVYTCAKCDEIVDAKVANYSVKMYGKVLCREDQRSAKPVKK